MHQGTMSGWRTFGDNSLPDLLMASGVGSASGASWSGAIFASSSTHARKAACLSLPYNSSGNFMLLHVSYIEPRPVHIALSYSSRSYIICWLPNPSLFLTATFLSSTQKWALLSSWALSYWRAYTVRTSSTWHRLHPRKEITFCVRKRLTVIDFFEGLC